MQQRLELDFSRQLEKLGVDPVKGLLVALSGGSDSMALAALAAALPDKERTAACRVRHGIRDGADDDAESRLCAEVCLSLGISFVEKVIPEGELAKRAEREGRGVEQAARTVRHGLLEAECRRMGFETILFGHTADDQLETVMMRLLSGAGAEGLKGIPPRRGMIARPLLGIARRELRGYLDSRGLAWADDPSNAENIYRRNRIRRELLPLMTDIFPGWNHALDVLRERSAETASALAALEEGVLPQDTEAEGFLWHRTDWDAAPDYLKARTLWKAADDLIGADEADTRLSWRRVKSIRRAADEGRRWSGGGLELSHEPGGIRLMRKNPEAWQGVLILDKKQAASGWNGRLGPFLVTVTGKAENGGEPVMLPPKDGRIRINLKEGRPLQIMTDSSSGKEFGDDRRNLVYILIQEDADARE